MRTRFLLRTVMLLLVMGFVAAPTAQAAGSRLALVIGNAAYPDSDTPLKQPLSDARAVADELKRAGFDVEVGENLTGQAMRHAIDRLYDKIAPEAAVLVFFSGFGIQSGRQSYLIPVDAQIWSEADVRRDGINLETLLGEINARGAGVKIAVLDASRRNPFERRFRSFSAGLAPVIAPSGTLVMYSAALSSVVSDADAGRSLFVSELLKEIRVPGLTAEDTLNRTRVGVTRASGGAQVPWLSSSLAEEFSFNAAAPAGTAPVEAAAPIAMAKPAATDVALQSAPARDEQPKPAEPPKQEPAADAAKPAAKTPEPQVAALPPQAGQDPPAKPAREESVAAALAGDPTVKALTARLDADPKDQDSWYRRGQVYASKGAYELAISDFNEAIRLNPRDVEAFNNRCWTHAVIGQTEPALKDCNEALRLRPGFVDALDSRGLVHLKSGRAKQAIADFDAALRINPRLTSSLYGRGIARSRSGAADAGRRDIANATAMDPDIAREFAGYGVE